MAKTVKLTRAQEQALIWAINTWSSTFDGMSEDDYEFYKEYETAYATLLPIYQQLED